MTQPVIPQPPFPQGIGAAVPCLPIPTLPLPTLPFPFSIAPPTLPSLKFSANVCCIPISFGIVPPPIQLPPLVVNPAVVKLLRQGAAAVQSWVDNLPLRCLRQ